MQTVRKPFKDQLRQMGFYNPSVTAGDSSLRFVQTEVKSAFHPNEVFILEKAVLFKADAVYFRHFTDGRPPMPQLFLYDNTDEKWSDAHLAMIHRDLWSSCLIPIFAVFYPTKVCIFDGRMPVRTTQNQIETAPLETLELTDEALSYYSASLFDSGLFWESAKAKKHFSIEKSAYRDLIKGLKDFLKTAQTPPEITHKILVFSILIKYLEERGTGKETLFAQNFFNDLNAHNLCSVLRQRGGVVRLFEKLSRHFNGKIFEWENETEKKVANELDLNPLADFLDANKDGAQFRFWRKYAFKHLPIELISSVYETLLGESKDVVYTPDFLVNTLLDDKRCLPLRNYQQLDFKVIDVSCGSGIFLVSAFKRLVQRWRYKQFVETGVLARPTAPVMLSMIKDNIFGVDIKEGAVRLTVFSLCLALCDELTPKEIWTNLKLDNTFQTNFKTQNFFAFLKDAPTAYWDLVVGNPPFIELGTQSPAYQTILTLNEAVAAKAKAKKYSQNQIALMFLDQVPSLVKENGLICLIMPAAPLLYNNSMAFRNDFFNRYQVTQIIDFTNLDATLFGKANVPTAAIYVQKTKHNKDKPITHVTIRRTKVVKEKLYFDVDAYDFHQVTQYEALTNKDVWKCNLLGGGRLKNLVERLSALRTIEAYIKQKNWVCGEGYIETQKEVKPTDYVSFQPFLEADDFDETGVSKIATSASVKLHRKTDQRIFKPPHLLIKQNIGVSKISTYLSKDYLTFKNTIVGIAALESDYDDLQQLHNQINTHNSIYRCLITAKSNKYLIIRATQLLTQDIMNLPYPEDASELALSFAETILCEDVLNYYNELLSKGENAKVNATASAAELNDFGSVFSKALNSIYKTVDKGFWLEKVEDLGNLYLCAFHYGTLKAETALTIQPNPQKETYLKNLIHFPLGKNIHLTRVLKHYEKNQIYLIKPKALRYWLKSIALRDADTVFADLLKAGY